MRFTLTAPESWQIYFIRRAQDFLLQSSSLITPNDIIITPYWNSTKRLSDTSLLLWGVMSGVEEIVYWERAKINEMIWCEFRTDFKGFGELRKKLKTYYLTDLTEHVTHKSIIQFSEAHFSMILLELWILSCCDLGQHWGLNLHYNLLTQQSFQTHKRPHYCRKSRCFVWLWASTLCIFMTRI